MLVLQIDSITGATLPYVIYVCDVYGNQCAVLTNINTPIPPSITLNIPSQFNNVPAIGIKIIDANGCEVFETTYCFEPTPTPTPTPTPIPLSAFTITLLEVGSDVVMSGYGGFNILDLTYVSTSGYGAGLNAQLGIFLLGALSSSSLDSYTGSTFSQPANFGGPATGTTTGSSSAGTSMGVFPANNLLIPTGYISGSYIGGSTTYFNRTLSSFGAIPGIYIYSWGSGVNSSIITLQVGP
jgi:hypothetical protein